MKQLIINRRLLCLITLLLLVAMTSGWASAAGDASVARSYTAGPSVLPGMLVELKTGSQSEVVPLVAKDAKKLLGAVVPVGDAELTLTPQAASAQQVLVAGSGRYTLLVSNQNGPIQSGDYLGVSGLNGVAMKAGSDQEQTIGRAVGSSDGRTDVIGKVPLQAGKGKLEAAIGRLAVNVQLAPNPAYDRNDGVPTFLNRAANGVASKPVSPARIYLSLALLLATLYMAANIFFAGVRSGIMAVGRNPLAKQAIGRSLIKTILGGLLVFAAGVVLAYLILSF